MSKAQPRPETAPVEPVLATSCLDFLLIELVPLAERITEQIHAREQALRDEYKRSKLFHRSNNNRNSVISTQSGGASTHTGPTATATDGTSSARDSVSGTGAETTTAGGAMDDESREALFWRLDQMGYRVGQGLVERFSANKPRPQTPLDAIKFICKDLWILLFKKQIDNLKTNHRGVFVLTDARFQPMDRMSADKKGGTKAHEEALRRAQTYLYFPCGVIRGALSGLGVDVSVHADSSEIPAAAFHIKTKVLKP